MSPVPAPDPAPDPATFACLPCEIKRLLLLPVELKTLSRSACVCRDLRNAAEDVLHARAGRAKLPTDGGFRVQLWRLLHSSAARTIAAGALHSAACIGGGLTTWGIDENQRGFLGIGHHHSRVPPTRVPVPTPASERQEIVAVATHSLHTLALTESGHCFSFGFGEAGQLGHGDAATLWRPRLITALLGERAVDVSAGQQHSLVLTAAGASYAFGSGFSGKLGLGDQRSHALPQRIGALAQVRVAVLEAGALHSLAADEGGAVHSFGCGSDWRLGHGTREDEHTPRPVAALLGRRIVRLAGGEHHSLAVDHAGQLYSWGAGEARERTSGYAGGWLGHRAVDPQPLPRPVAALCGVRIAAVAASSRHSLALADGGALFSFGDGDGGKLGHDDGGRMHWVPTRIRALEGLRVAAVTAGEAHSMCVLEDGRLLSWGCGGALGLPRALLETPEQPASWASAGNYEWAPGDEERRWQAHVPTPVAVVGLVREPTDPTRG